MKLNRISISSFIVGVFCGTVLTLVFNWIIFKSPKTVTAPGVAALLSICTFSLALWSAFKVDKWLKNKINETAFKKADDFVVSLCDLSNNVHEIIFNLNGIRISDNEEEYNYFINELKENLTLMSSNVFTLYGHRNTFNTWCIIFHQSEALSKISSRLGFVNGILTNVMMNGLHEFSEKNKDQIRRMYISAKLESTVMYLDAIIAKPYYEKFSLKSINRQKAIEE